MQMLLKKSLMAAALSAACVGSASAAAIIGSKGLLLSSLDPSSGVNLATLTGFNSMNLFTSDAATGNFIGFPAFTAVGSASLDFSNLAAFQFGNPNVNGFGWFQATSGYQVSNTGGSRSFRIDGNFTAGSAFPGLTDPTTATLTITFTQSVANGSISGSATLDTPRLAVPVPGSLALLGLGVFGLGLASRRKAA